MDASKRENKVDYIEFRVSSLERAQTFYGGVFGWTFQAWGDSYVSFADGRLDGGFELEGPDDIPHPRKGGALVIVYASALEETSARIEELGGTIIKPIFSFPGGRRFHFTDPEGYELAVWEELPHE